MVLVELIGFVLVPCILYANGSATAQSAMGASGGSDGSAGDRPEPVQYHHRRIQLSGAAPLLSVLMEVVITAPSCSPRSGIFRWMVHRMPVLRAAHD